jgi:hypothetical protein
MAKLASGEPQPRCEPHLKPHHFYPLLYHDLIHKQFICAHRLSHSPQLIALWSSLTIHVTARILCPEQ